MSRDNEELIKKVFLAQRDDPTVGDLKQLIEKDLEMLGATYEEVISNKFTKQKLKLIATLAAFSFLLNKKGEPQESKANSV